MNIQSFVITYYRNESWFSWIGAKRHSLILNFYMVPGHDALFSIFQILSDLIDKYQGNVPPTVNTGRYLFTLDEILDRQCFVRIIGHNEIPLDVLFRCMTSFYLEEEQQNHPGDIKAYGTQYDLGNGDSGVVVGAVKLKKGDRYILREFNRLIPQSKCNAFAIFTMTLLPKGSEFYDVDLPTDFPPGYDSSNPS